MKQIAVACYMYADDNNQFYHQYRENGSTWHWPYLLFEYVSEEKAAFLCPANARTPNTVNPQPPAIKTHYGWSWRELSRGSPTAIPVTIIEVTDPVNTIAYCDSNGWVANWYEAAWHVEDIHQKGANITFCDGHVARMLQTTVFNVTN